MSHRFEPDYASQNFAYRPVGRAIEIRCLDERLKMKIYISYFAQIRNFPPNLVGLSTAIWNPKWLQKGRSQNGIIWLKENGYWDQIVNIAQTAGKAAAIAWCTPYLSTPVCTLAVNAICSIFGI